MPFEKLCKGQKLSLSDFETLIRKREQYAEELQKLAKEKTEEIFGKKIYIRGLVEITNICKNDCLYCGIRKSNAAVPRYAMSKEEILAAAEYSWKNGYGSVVLQSGERRDSGFIEFVADVTRSIKKLSSNELGITLSCGIQSADVYSYWKSSGADRYLLRIETTDEKLFASLHPDGDFFERKQALSDLKSCGYITGTGVMTGLPGQTCEMLAKDVAYFRELGADMIGLGPYVTHEQAVLQEFGSDTPERQKERLELAYKMISVCRVVLKNVNIASATALSALEPERGRVEGLLSGANVIMPNAGDISRRKDYHLYNNKPDTGEPLELIRKSAEKAGCSIELFTQGNPPR